MTDWSRLTDAHGAADDIPALLDHLLPDSSTQAWNELWSRLCHQGTVYSASYAALPVLTRKAREWSAADRADPLLLAGAIVSSTQQAHDEQKNPHATYAAEIAELLALTEEALQAAELVADPAGYVALLGTALAFEGVEVWSEQLDGLIREEFELPCPHCKTDNFVAFGEYGYFSTLDDMYMNDNGSERIPLRPVDSSALTGTAHRLYTRMLADGHPDIAAKLTFVFGCAECAECRAVFQVDEAVVARWG